MKRVVIGLIIVAAVVTAMLIYQRSARQSTESVGSRASMTGTTGQLYQCSMHPQIVSDKPGVCPICGMRLEPVERISPAANASAPGVRKILFYRHPMRPDVTSPTPAKDEMGMDYVPVYADEMTEGAGDVPGHAGFSLSTERQQLIGVTRGRVGVTNLFSEIRTVGNVAYDPDLYEAIVEYRASSDREAGAALVQASALRLRQMGLSEEMIAELAGPGHDPKSLLLPGKEMWVYAQVYENEVGLIRAGQPVEVTALSVPGHTYTATIVAVDPILNATTRTLRARILVSTPEEDLRPGMFVNVKLEIPLGQKLAVPQEAVLDTGDHQIVFVVKGAGAFEPHSVTLGRKAGDYYEVLNGLENGDEVVTSANFLIDSESRFRSAVAAFAQKPTIVR
jgi:membrane fusion protein, copper/silver efflux system